MRSFTTLLVTAALSSLVSAQYSINPNNVPLATRQSWCNSQEASCPLICLQYPGNSAATESNTCDPNGLSYSCVCSSGMSPNASQYSQTLPYFVCSEWGNECVTNCGSNSDCASNCRSQHPCGAQNPTRQNTSTLTSTMMKTSTSGAPAGATTGADGTIYTGFGGAAATSSGSSSGSTGSSSSGSTSGAAMALEMGQAYGLVMVAAGLFGGFALML